MGFIAGTPEWCDPQSGPGDARGAEGCLERGNATLTLGATRGELALGTLIKVTSEHHCAELETQVTDQEEQGNTDGPPLGALVVVVNVGDREVGARLVGSSAEPASNNHALEGPCSIPELARDEERNTRAVGFEGVLVEEDGAAVLGNHAELFLQRHVVAEARASLHAVNMPRAIEVACQQTRVRTPNGSRIPGKKL